MTSLTNGETGAGATSAPETSGPADAETSGRAEGTETSRAAGATSRTRGATTVDWRHELTEQLDWHWSTLVRPRLGSLTDEEYLWEPVAGCWSVRPRGTTTATHAVGGGALVVDFELPEPVPPPLTTIAWRLVHLTVGVFGVRAGSHFGWWPPGARGAITYDTVEYSASASEALAALDEAYAAWMDGVRALDDVALARPCGPAEGPYADHPFAALVLHINREALHHSAEVLLLRDLYRTSEGGRRFTGAPDDGREQEGSAP